ncbi:MAG: molybdopterin-dependent oxidoreductase, partial [Deltaproteobacteria bacterium]
HKGLASAEKLNHPDRLRYPLKRIGKRGEGKWERISWDSALKEIADNFIKIKETHGARAVAFCVGMPKGLEHFVLIRLANIFGSPNVVASQDVCHAPREIAGIHTCGFYPVVDLHHQSKMVMLWGSNITSTNEEGEISSLLTEQIKNGTKIIVIDPRKTDMAKKADLWLRLKPGSDCALALGMMNVIISESLYDKDFVENWTVGFDELAKSVAEYTPEAVSKICWVEAQTIRDVAIAYAQAKSAALQWGNAIEHTTDTFETTRALICLMAICGNLDVAGGNVEAHDPKIMGLGQFVRADLIPNKRKEMISNHYGVIPRLMTVSPAYFRKAILEAEPYPVKAAYIMCANPIVNYADSQYTIEALKQLEFIAVAEIFMTPTASLADIVLPVATQYEINDIGHYGIGHGYILSRPKIVEPPAECRPDMQILNDLGKLVSDPALWHDNYENFLSDLLAPAELSYEQFVDVGYLKGKNKFGAYKTDGFKTPTKKVELALSIAEKFKLNPTPCLQKTSDCEIDENFPLLLTSAKSRFYMHSAYRNLDTLRKRAPNPTAEIHPQTAKMYGIVNGAEMIIETKNGKIVQMAKFNDEIDERVIVAPIGWWYPENKDAWLFDVEKSNFNMLTSIKELGKEFATPNLRALPCRIISKDSLLK